MMPCRRWRGCLVRNVDGAAVSMTSCARHWAFGMARARARLTRCLAGRGWDGSCKDLTMAPMKALTVCRSFSGTVQTGRAEARICACLALRARRFSTQSPYLSSRTMQTVHSPAFTHPAWLRPQTRCTWFYVDRCWHDIASDRSTPYACSGLWACRFSSCTPTYLACETRLTNHSPALTCPAWRCAEPAAVRGCCHKKRLTLP